VPPKRGATARRAPPAEVTPVAQRRRQHGGQLTVRGEAREVVECAPEVVVDVAVRPAGQDQAGDRDTVLGEPAGDERGVRGRVRARPRDHQRRRPHSDSEVRQRPSVERGERGEQPTAALDEHEPLRGVGVEIDQLPHGLGELQLRQARGPRGVVRRQRAGVARELVHVSAPGQPGDLEQVAAAPAARLRQLDGGDRPLRRRGQRRDGQRLARARPGARDDDDAHPSTLSGRLPHQRRRPRPTRLSRGRRPAGSRA